LLKIFFLILTPIILGGFLFDINCFCYFIIRFIHRILLQLPCLKVLSPQAPVEYPLLKFLFPGKLSGQYFFNDLWCCLFNLFYRNLCIL